MHVMSSSFHIKALSVYVDCTYYSPPTFTLIRSAAHAFRLLTSDGWPLLLYPFLICPPAWDQSFPNHISVFAQPAARPASALNAQLSWQSESIPASLLDPRPEHRILALSGSGALSSVNDSHARTCPDGFLCHHIHQFQFVQLLQRLLCTS